MNTWNTIGLTICLILPMRTYASLGAESVSLCKGNPSLCKFPDDQISFDWSAPVPVAKDDTPTTKRVAGKDRPKPLGTMEASNLPGYFASAHRRDYQASGSLIVVADKPVGAVLTGLRAGVGLNKSISS